MKRVAVITSSDKGYRGKREDLSGPAVKEIMEAAGYDVVSVDVLPDDRGLLSARMAEIADRRVLSDRWQQVGDVTKYKDIADRSSVSRPSSRFIQKNNLLKFSCLIVDQ